MKILQLEINDLKKIRAVEIHPRSGKPVILTGDNGNGKSSVLDAIVLALANNGLEDPIRHGRPSASVRLTLGADKAEYLLERRITKKGSYLTLTDAEGNTVQKAQTFLNGLLGNYAFDPLEFTRLKSKPQVEALKEAAGLDFAELDAERAEKYATRTEVNRQGKEIKARFDAMEAPADDVPAEELSASTLMENLQSLREKAMLVERTAEETERANTRLSEAKAEVDRIQKLLIDAQTKVTGLSTKAEESRADEVEAISEAPDAAALTAAKEAVEAVDRTNAAVRAARTYRETEEELKRLRVQTGKLNREIEVIDETKADAVKNSSLPLDGLELTDDGVMFNGTFFSQLSTAEQIRVSTLVAMSQNPGLKLILIREGALMNSANLTMIASLANDQGYQLWIEKFQENASDIGLHIEDGSIVVEDGKKTEEEEEA